jgi:hypothetical protein
MELAEAVHRSYKMSDQDQDQVKQIQDQLFALQEQLAELRQAQSGQAPRVGRMAKGTRDITKQAQQAVGGPPPEALISRIERALRRETLTLGQLSKTTGAREPDVLEVLGKATLAGQVFNVGSTTHPVWTWKLGDKGSPQELTLVVRRLISERPMTTRQLTDATGARFARVGGVIVNLQRTEPPDRFLNMGTARVGRWFLIPSNAKSAALAPKSLPRIKI